MKASAESTYWSGWSGRSIYKRPRLEAWQYDCRHSLLYYPNKYYCDDLGLCNAHIGFRQQKLTHNIMENTLYNELRVRDCEVDIGVVYGTEKNKKGQSAQVAREIDFIATRGGKKTYIQSIYALDSDEKAAAENKPLSLTGDAFPKINCPPRYPQALV